MDLIEKYFLLFTDSLFANLAFTISGEIIIHTMKIFNEGNTAIIVCICTVSFILASIVNYLLGRIANKVFAPSDEEGNKNNRLQVFASSKYVPLFLLLSGAPIFGKFIILFAGFSKIKPQKALLYGTISKFGYYLVIMYLL